LTQDRDSGAIADGEIHAAVAEAYSSALRGVAPHRALIGRATDREFRRFVNDMVELLSRRVDQQAAYPFTGTIPRDGGLVTVRERSCGQGF
jgi:hypothetical protein